MSLFRGHRQTARVLAYGARGVAALSKNSELMGQALVVEGFIRLEIDRSRSRARRYFLKALKEVKCLGRVALSAMVGLARSASNEEDATEWLQLAARRTDPRLDAANARIHWLQGQQAFRFKRFYDACGAYYAAKLRLRTSPLDLGLLNLDLAAALLAAGNYWMASAMINEAGAALTSLGDGLWLKEARQSLSALAAATLTVERIMMERKKLARRAQQLGARKFSI